MPIKIKFDSEHNVIPPTLVLSTRSNKKIGKIPYFGLVVSDGLNEAAEMSFKVNKKDCAENIWKSLVDFKLVWVNDWDRWYEINVEIDETVETIKSVSARHLTECELSQAKLNGIEINTEDDILRDDYVPIVLYSYDKKASLLDKILQKTPHIIIRHVDDSIMNIQRTFSFSGTTIYDAMMEISKEINCLFVFDSYSEDNKIVRSVSVYDLENNCNECGERGEFAGKCPKCGGNNIRVGYGLETPVFVSVENAADEIGYSTDAGALKNCFYLEAGDDLMTATVANCNPNGTRYIWNITDRMKADMSDELIKRLEEYDAKYKEYQYEKIPDIDGEIVNKYNALIEKYKSFDGFDIGIAPINSIVGYDGIMEILYGVIDMYYYLLSGMMPTVKMSDTSAQEQAEKIASALVNPVAVRSLESASKSTIDSAVLAMAKAAVDTRYQTKIVDSSYDNGIWYGTFSIINYSDDDDYFEYNNAACEINDNYENFIKQRVEKVIAKDEANKELGISELFKLGISSMSEELRKYSLNRLVSFHDSCQSCLDVMIEGGIGGESQDDSITNLYKNLYMQYYEKLTAIESEIKVRENEINIINGVHDVNGGVILDGVQTYLIKAREEMSKELSLDNFLGEELMHEFAGYRREDTYSNQNYISDGLSNSELFSKAKDFFDVATKEIKKSSEPKHQITSTLKNLFVLKGFEKIADDFQVGNFIRIKSDDGIYRLRLMRYQIDFDNSENISVDFSDATSLFDYTRSFADVINDAASMATTYEYVARQAKQGSEGKDTLDGWHEDGLNTTNTRIVNSSDAQTQMWDNHGMLFRKENDSGDGFDDKQLKIINSTIAVTDDNWNSVKTAIGEFLFLNPRTGELESVFGVNGEAIVGRLILGEELHIYNESGSLSFGGDTGLEVTNGTNTFIVAPQSDKIMRITKKISDTKTEDVFYFDQNGTLHISGDGAKLEIQDNSAIQEVNEGIATIGSALNTKIDGIGLTSEEIDSLFAEIVSS